MNKCRFFGMNLVVIMSVILMVGCGGGGSGGDGSDQDDNSSPSVWFQTYDPSGESYSTQAYGKDVTQTTDGGYAIVGSCEDLIGNGYELLFFKTDATGEVISGYANGNSGNDYGASVQQSTDGGYIVLGDFMMGSNRQMWLIKYNSELHQEWDRLFGYSDQNEFAGEVQQTTDGGYILVGTTAGTHTNVFLIKTNGSAATQWYDQKGYDDYDELGTSVRQTSDGGYIFTGRTNRFDSYFDCWLVKVDASGNTVWHNHYGSAGVLDEGTSVRQTNDGGYIVVGTTQSSSSDIFLIKTDSTGNQQWSSTIGGPNSHWGEDVQQTSDGGYIIAGTTESSEDLNDGYLIKTNSTGNIIWEQTFGGSGEDAFYSVQQTSDGGYIIVGSSESYGDGTADVFLVKTDQNGSPLP
jgi:hypothetical protein